MAIHSIFSYQDRVLRRPIETTANSGYWKTVAGPLALSWLMRLRWYWTEASIWRTSPPNSRPLHLPRRKLEIAFAIFLFLVSLHFVISLMI
jgi:hypothetical protein